MVLPRSFTWSREVIFIWRNVWKRRALLDEATPPPCARRMSARRLRKLQITILVSTLSYARRGVYCYNLHRF